MCRTENGNACVSAVCLTTKAECVLADGQAPSAAVVSITRQTGGSQSSVCVEASVRKYKQA